MKSQIKNAIKRVFERCMYQNRYNKKRVTSYLQISPCERKVWKCEFLIKLITQEILRTLNLGRQDPNIHRRRSEPIHVIGSEPDVQ